jgi:membrane protein DedA with SNARE-associated domain
MKVFVLCSGAMRVNRWRFYATLLAGRIPRYVGLGYLGAILGEESKAKLWVKSHLLAMGGFAVLLALALYLLIRLNDHNRDRKATAASAAGPGAAE